MRMRKKLYQSNLLQRTGVALLCCCALLPFFIAIFQDTEDADESLLTPSDAFCEKVNDVPTLQSAPEGGGGCCYLPLICGDKNALHIHVHQFPRQHRLSYLLMAETHLFALPTRPAPSTLLRSLWLRV